MCFYVHYCQLEAPMPWHFIACHAVFISFYVFTICNAWIGSINGWNKFGAHVQPNVYRQAICTAKASLTIYDHCAVLHFLSARLCIQWNESIPTRYHCVQQISIRSSTIHCNASNRQASNKGNILTRAAFVLIGSIDLCVQGLKMSRRHA